MAAVDIRGAPMGPAGALGPAVATDGDGMQALRDELARERREHDRMASKLDSLRQARAELQSMTAFCHGEVGRLQSTVALLKLHPTAGPAADSATDTKPVAPAAVTTGATGTVELDAVYRSAVAQADQLAGLKQGRRLDQLADALRTRRSLASNLVASTRVASAVATDRPAVVLARCPALLRWRNELAAETGQHGAASMHDPSFGSADERSGSILPGDSLCSDCTLAVIPAATARDCTECLTVRTRHRGLCAVVALSATSVAGGPWSAFLAVCDLPVPPISTQLEVRPVRLHNRSPHPCPLPPPGCAGGSGAPSPRQPLHVVA